MIYPDPIKITDHTTEENTVQTPTGGWIDDTTTTATEVYSGHADVVENLFGQTLRGAVADEGDAFCYLNILDKDLDPHALQSGQEVTTKHHTYRIKKIDPFSMVLLMEKEDDDN